MEKKKLAKVHKTLLAHFSGLATALMTATLKNFCFLFPVFALHPALLYLFQLLYHSTL